MPKDQWKREALRCQYKGGEYSAQQEREAQLAERDEKTMARLQARDKKVARSARTRCLRCRNMTKKGHSLCGKCKRGSK